MVDVPITAAVGAVVAVYPWSVMRLFVGLCVTILPVPMFSVAPDCSCCVTSKVIVSSSN